MNDREKDLYIQLLYAQIKYWKDMAYANKQSLEYYKGIVEAHLDFDVYTSDNNDGDLIEIDDIMQGETYGVDTEAPLEEHHPEECLGYEDYTNIEDTIKGGNEDEH